MKKMMKIAAASLCLALAITTLSACSSTDNNKPAEETSKSAEEVTITEESTEEPAQEPTEETTVETTQEATAGIIPAYRLREESRVLETDPVTWFDYDQFNRFFGTAITDKTVGDGIPVYRIENWPATISVAQDPIDVEYTGAIFDIGFYVYNNGGQTCCCFELDGEIKLMANFVPLVYDPDAKVIFGYGANTDGSNGKFMELYYSTAFNDLVGFEISDPSIYGF